MNLCTAFCQSQCIIYITIEIKYNLNFQIPILHSLINSCSEWNNAYLKYLYSNDLEHCKSQTQNQKGKGFYFFNVMLSFDFFLDSLIGFSDRDVHGNIFISDGLWKYFGKHIFKKMESAQELAFKI